MAGSAALATKATLRPVSLGVLKVTQERRPDGALLIRSTAELGPYPEKLTKRPAFNAIVSNVRGPQPLSLYGAPVVAVRSMGPVTRVLGLNMTAWTYGDNFSVGLHSCREFMPDLWSLTDHLQDALEELKKAVAGKV